MKIQTYDQPTVQNRPIGDTSQRLDARGAFGSQVGQELARTGNLMGRVANDMREQEDMAEVKKATSQLREQINQVTFLDQNAYYNQQGKNAFDGYEPTKKEIEKRRQGIAKNLKSERQQKLFSEVSAQYVDSELDSMSRHAAKGRSQWLDEEDAGTIAIAQTDGSLRPESNEVYSKQIKASIKNLAQRNGWTPEKTEIETVKNLTAMHKTAFDNLLIRNPKGAKDYIDKHADEIAPTELPKMQAVVQEQVDAQWSMEKADEIRTAGGSLTQRINKAREETKDDPDKRKILMNQISADYSIERQARNDAQTDVYAQFTQQLLDGKSGAQIRMENPGQWEVLSASQRTALLKPASSDSKTDIGAYYEYKGLETKQEKQEYFLENAGRFSTSDAKKIIDEINSNEPARTPSVTNKTAFDNTVTTILGPKPPAKSASDQKEWTRRYSMLNGIYEEMLNEEYPGQKDITESQRRDVLDRFYTTVQRDRTWLGLIARSPLEIGLDDVPLDAKDSIMDLLRSQGYAITPESILKVYNSEEWRESNQ